MEYKADELGRGDIDKNNNNTSPLGFVMASFRFTKDVFGGEVAPYVRLIKPRNEREYWQPVVCEPLPIKHT